MAISATVPVETGSHNVKLQACKAETANADFIIDPETTDHATLVIEEIDLSGNQLSEFALQLDGSDDDIIATGYKGITGTGARSVVMWLKTETTATNSSLIDWGSANVEEIWNLILRNDAGAYDLGLEIYSGKAVWTEGDNPEVADIADGNWHHLAITAPAAGKVEDINLYFDGQLQTTPSYLGSSTAEYDTGSTYDVRIGNRSTSSSIPFSGTVDEVGVFSTELSSVEVLALYNNGEGLDLSADEGDYESSTALELYYKLEEGAGSTTADGSGSARNGTITGGAWIEGLDD